MNYERVFSPGVNTAARLAKQAPLGHLSSTSDAKCIDVSVDGLLDDPKDCTVSSVAPFCQCVDDDPRSNPSFE